MQGKRWTFEARMGWWAWGVWGHLFPIWLCIGAVELMVQHFQSKGRVATIWQKLFIQISLLFVLSNQTVLAPLHCLNTCSPFLMSPVQSLLPSNMVFRRTYTCPRCTSRNRIKKVYSYNYTWSLQFMWSIVYAHYFKANMMKKIKYLIHRLTNMTYGKFCFSFSMVLLVCGWSSWVKGNLNVWSIFRWRLESCIYKKNLNQDSILI